MKLPNVLLTGQWLPCIDLSAIATDDFLVRKSLRTVAIVGDLKSIFDLIFME